MGNEVGGEERVPANGASAILQVVIKARTRRRDDHLRNGTFGPPRLEQGLQFDQGIARSTRA